MDFYVPDTIWEAAAGGCTVLCIACFDRRAEKADVDYGGAIVVLGRRSWLACGVAAKALEARQAAAREAARDPLSEHASLARMVRSA